jgi:hypothetical protein
VPGLPKLTRSAPLWDGIIATGGDVLLTNGSTSSTSVDIHTNLPVGYLVRF